MANSRALINNDFIKVFRGHLSAMAGQFASEVSLTDTPFWRYDLPVLDLKDCLLRLFEIKGQVGWFKSRQNTPFPLKKAWYYEQYLSRFHGINNMDLLPFYAGMTDEIYLKEKQLYDARIDLAKEISQNKTYQSLLALKGELCTLIKKQNQLERQEQKRIQQIEQRRRQRKEAAKERQRQREINRLAVTLQEQERRGGLPPFHVLKVAMQEANASQQRNQQLITKCIITLRTYLSDYPETSFLHSRQSRVWHLIGLLRLTLKQYKEAASEADQQDVYNLLVADIFLHYQSIGHSASILSRKLEKCLLTLLRARQMPGLKWAAQERHGLWYELTNLFYRLKRSVLHFLPGRQKRQDPVSRYISERIVMGFPGVNKCLFGQNGRSVVPKHDVMEKLKQLRKLDYAESSFFGSKHKMSAEELNHCLGLPHEQTKNLLRDDAEILFANSLWRST